ncbi:MAG: hypothetical protein NZM37_03695 [Sandaracinaceae bacterium]|nr:hypothetical protein [Sandaracinaceae bacterium]
MWLRLLLSVNKAQRVGFQGHSYGKVFGGFFDFWRGRFEGKHGLAFVSFGVLLGVSASVNAQAELQANVGVASSATVSAQPLSPPVLPTAFSASGSFSGAPFEIESGEGPAFRVGLGAHLGWSRMDPPVDGHSAALDLALEIDILEWLAFGIHSQVSWRNALVPDANHDGRADGPATSIPAVALTGGPRFRLLTASQARDHLGLEVGAGILSVPEGQRPWGALLEVALLGGIDLRMLGGSRGSDGFVLSPTLRYQQGIGAAGGYQAALAGVMAFFDWDSRPRRVEGAHTGLRFTWGIDGGIGWGPLRQRSIREALAFDLGMALGLILGEVVEPRLRLDFMHRVGGEGSDGLDVYGIGGGVRLLFDQWVPLYLEAMGGWAFRFGTPAPVVAGGAFVDVGGGLRWVDCGESEVAFVLGGRLQIGVHQNDAMTALLGVGGIEFDAGPRPDRPRCRPSPSDQTVVVTPSLPPPPPLPPVEAPPVQVQPPTQTESPPIVVVDGAPPSTPSSSPSCRIHRRPPSVATRNESDSTPLPLSIEPFVGLGVASSNRLMDGPVAGVGLAFGWSPFDWLMMQIRALTLHGSDVATDHIPPLMEDDVEEQKFAALLLGSNVRFRLLTDASQRSGWVFDLGAGLMTHDGAPAVGRRGGWEHGGYVEGGIGHQRGFRFGNGFAIQFGLALRLQQGIGDLTDYRALLLNGWLTFEADTPQAQPGRRDADFQYTFGIRGRGGLSLFRVSDAGIHGMWGASLHFGLPIGRWVEPRLEGDVHFMSNAMGKSFSPLIALLGALRLRFDEVLPMYVQGGVGHAWHYEVAKQIAPGSVFLDVGAGARFNECSGRSDGAIELGIHFRYGLDIRVDDAVYLVLGYEYAGGAPMFGRGERAICKNEPGEQEGMPKESQGVEANPVLPLIPSPPPLPPIPKVEGDVQIDIHSGSVDVRMPQVQGGITIEVGTPPQQPPRRPHLPQSDEGASR